jgi:hypothetical protein
VNSPPNGSHAKSPGSDDSRRTRSINSTGFQLGGLGTWRTGRAFWNT